MRKVAVGLGMILVVALIAVLIIPAVIDVNRYRPQIESRLRERLGRDVSLGEMRVSLFPLAFRVQNAVIGEDPQFNTGRPFAQVQTFYVRPDLFALMKRDIQIQSLQLDHPVIEVIRNAKGVWNFSSLMTKQEPDKQRDYSLDKLKIYDGQIALTDLQQSGSRAVYDHIDLLLYDFDPDKPFSIEARAHMPGTGEQQFELDGKAGPLARDGFAKTPFDGKLKLDSVSLSALQRFVNAQVLENSDAILTGNAVIKNNGGAMSSSGQLEARDARVRGVQIGYPMIADYQISANLNDSTFAIQKADLRLGKTPVSVDGTVNGSTHPAQLDLNVKSSNASIAELARLAAAFGVAFNARTDVSGNINLNAHLQGAASQPSLSGRIAARDVRVTGGDLREPVQVDAIDLALSPDAIRSSEFTARTGRTSAAAQFTLSAYTSPSPKIDAKLNTESAQLQELLRMAHAYGVSAVEGVDGSGVVTLNVNASGPLRQSNEMTFSGSGTIRSASLDLPSMAKPIAVRKADLSFTDDGIGLNDIDISLGQTTAQGNLTLRDFESPRVQFAVTANHINVAEWEDLFRSPQRKAAKQESLLARMTGSGSLTAAKVVYDDLTLSNVRSNVLLDHGVITMKPQTADLFNGQETGSIVVNTRVTPATYTFDSRLQNVDANQLLSTISPVKQMLYGLLSANADTRFTTAAGAHGILPTLNGKVSLNLKDGKIANVDLLHQLATLAQFQRTASTVEPFTQLIQLTGDFVINNGVARTNNLTAQMDAGSLAADGTIDLAQQKLNLRLTTVLSPDYSQRVGGTNIGGFLSTAFANDKGELVIPVIVTGTLQNPQFAPDLQKVAEMKLQNVVPGLGGILRSKPGMPSQQQEQTRPGVQDLLDLFRKK